MVAAAIVLPALHGFVPTQQLEQMAATIGTDAATLLHWAANLQVIGFTCGLAVILWQSRQTYGWTFASALAKSVLFAVLVGVPFTVGMIFLSLLFLPTAPGWMHVLLGTVPVAVLVVGMSVWFSKGVKTKNAEIAP